MNQRLKIIMMTALILASAVGVALAAPIKLSSISAAGKLDRYNQPSYVAQDAIGNLYVTISKNNVVHKFSGNGDYLGSLSVMRPKGIGVDATGLIYVCSETNKRIEVYNQDFTFVRVLAGGDDDPIHSSKIAFDNAGNIYVIDRYRRNNDDDHEHGMIRVFDAAGAPQASISSFGSATGYLNQPTGMALNEAADEIYVADAPIRNINGAPTRTARIQVFVKSSGFYKRTLPITYGVGANQIANPGGIALDAAGNVYIADTGRMVITYFTAFGVALGFINDISGTPTDIIIGADNVAHITNSGISVGSIENYGLDGYVTMKATPVSLSFTATHLGANPDSQTVIITNAGSGSLTWNSSTDVSWLTTTDQVASGGSGTVVAMVNIAGLAAGVRTGTITITSDAGLKTIVPVTLTVNAAPGLVLNDGTLTFAAKKGVNPAPKTVSFQPQTTPVYWTAVPSAAWVSISPASGNTNTTSATVSIDASKLPANGTSFSTSIVFSTVPSGMLGDGSTLLVNMNIISSNRVRVTTNKVEATFTLVGPNVNSKGTGSLVIENAEAGNYTVTFDVLAGYRKPQSQTKMLVDGGELTFVGNFTSVKKNIITARGPWVNNDARIKIFKADGTPAGPDLNAFDGRYGATIAVCDVDGDGTAEIITGSGAGPENPTTVRIFRSDRVTLLNEFTAFPAARGGVNVGAGDFDGDGKCDVIVAPAGGSEQPGIVKIFSYNVQQDKMVDTGVNILAHGFMSGVNISAAIIDGSAAPRLVTAPVTGIEHDAGYAKIWKVNTGGGIGSWYADNTPMEEILLHNRYGATIAAGDIDGDGSDEIILGVGPDKGSDSDRAQVKVYKGDGTEIKRIQVFEDKYSINVASVDVDGNGTAEIIVGMGPDPSMRGGSSSSDDREDRKSKKGRITKQKADREGEHDDHQSGAVRVYNATGELINTFVPYEESKFGVKVAAGDLGL